MMIMTAKEKKEKGTEGEDKIKNNGDNKKKIKMSKLNTKVKRGEEQNLNNNKKRKEDSEKRITS